MGALYVSDEHGLGTFDMAMVVLATHTIERYLEKNRLTAESICERRRRIRPREDHSRWTLPPKH